MAGVIRPDEIDFNAYEAATEARAKVKPASLFASELKAQFAERKPGGRQPLMFSTKMRNCIEFRPGEVTAWAGYNGHRKALALDTPIPTPTGWATMGELQAGDRVFDENGLPCRVVVKSPVYLNEVCYRLSFSDGTEVVAHAGHEWLTDTMRSRQSARSAKWRDRNGRVGSGENNQTHKREFARVRTTQEIYETLKVQTGCFAGKTNHSVRLARPLQMPEAELPLAPYVLGAWLGDGTSRDGAITIADHEVTAQFVANGWPVSKRSAKYLYGVPGLKVKLRALGVLNQKHIPGAYLRSSASQREELLRGLMDTDGCAHVDGTLSFCSTKQDLADGVAELVCSLGWQCVTRRGIAKLEGREIGPKWEVVFSADRPVFSIDRKQARSKSELSERAKARFIVACEPIESVPVQCIEVDSPSHLYLATRSMIPTHNSIFTGQVALDLCAQMERTLIASFEMDSAVTLARMARQCFGVAKPSTPSLDAFADWTDERLWMFDHTGTITSEQVISVCRYFADKLQGHQVFIDSMMMVCASEEKLDEQKRFATSLVRVAQETGLHIHLIAHCRKPAAGGEERPPTKYELRGSAAVSDQFHNVITVWANKAKKEKLEQSPGDYAAQMDPDALVSIEKQRNGPFEGKLKLWFHDESMRFLDERTSHPEPYAIR